MAMAKYSHWMLFIIFHVLRKIAYTEIYEKNFDSPNNDKSLIFQYSKRRGKEMEILTYILQGMLALMFFMAGTGKITGSKMHVEGFKHWGLPQWFRVVTGIIEFASAALLIIGYWIPNAALAGAFLLGCVGIGGVLTHIRVRDSFKDTAPILFLGILAWIVFFLYLLEMM